MYLASFKVFVYKFHKSEVAYVVHINKRTINPIFIVLKRSNALDLSFPDKTLLDILF